MKNNIKKSLVFLVFLSLALLTGECFAKKVLNSISPHPSQHNHVRLVEYYDDECPHCHRMGPIIEQLKASYPDLEVIYRPTPILNANSWAVASLVKASGNQKAVLHERLMQLSYPPTPEDVFSIASQLGINRKILLLSAESSSIQKDLQNNIRLAEAQLGSGGVALPLLVFNNVGKKNSNITLIGEKPYDLLSAVVKQLE